MRIRISDECQDAGRCGTVAGAEVLAGQWWCPVLWDDAEDPDFHKSSCLEPLGGVTPEDWREVLRTLTRAMCGEPENLPAKTRQEHLMEIVGKIGSGNMGGLDDGDLGEIRRSLEADAPSCIDGGAGLRTILGRIGPAGGPARLTFRCATGTVNIAFPEGCQSREELLARVYNMAPSSVAQLCDEELDASGALLARVRVLAAKGKAARREAASKVPAPRS